MKIIGVVRFPGSNCDLDVFSFIKKKNLEPRFLWHLDQFNVADYHSIILPGGFSYGDYLRSGALASRSPVMKSVHEFANKGGPVLGICNGFQILAEANLLPGTLVRNTGLRFIDDWVSLKVEKKNQYWGNAFTKPVIRLPIAHGDGRFYAAAEDLKRIEDENLVWLRYTENPNGSLNDIAGVMNKKTNVVGLMPHPERAIQDWMGGTDGWDFL